MRIDRRLRTIAGLSEKAAKGYKPMADAPYELDSVKLKYMQKMERALDHILSHLDDLSLDIADCAEKAGLKSSYFVRAFRSYFGHPFGRYVSMLRLRQAAREIIDGAYPFEAGKKYGFASTQSFSKAFKKEFGLSPRNFQGGGYDVPDMPARLDIVGLTLSLEYREIDAIRVGGIVLDPPRGSETFMMDSCSLAFTDGCRRSEAFHQIVSGESETAGAWWFDPDEGLKYIFGKIKERYDTVYRTPLYDPQTSAHDVIFQGGNFAVWSYKRPADDADIPLLSRIMWRYVLREWVPENRKVPNRLRCTYELFTEDRVYMYLPLQSGFRVTDVLVPHQWGISNWTRYIDEHITDKLSLESLSFRENYSTQNYKDLFSMYYGITPTAYIRRRRIVLAMSELEHADNGKEQRAILRKYHFTNRETMDRLSVEEFGMSAEEVSKAFDAVENDSGAKKREADSIRCVMKALPERAALVRSVDKIEAGAIPTETVERIMYWLRNEFPDFFPVKTLFVSPEEKIFIWGDDPEKIGVNMFIHIT